MTEETYNYFDWKKFVDMAIAFGWKDVQVGYAEDWRGAEYILKNGVPQDEVAPSSSWATPCAKIKIGHGVFLEVHLGTTTPQPNTWPEEEKQRYLENINV